MPYIDLYPPWVHMCSPSWPSPHFPPHPISQGHPSAPALSTLSHASNLDWHSVSHMVIYRFQCYSLKSSHPSGSSQCTSPKHPVSCIEPGLAICFTYDNLHGSMPFCQIIPPSPSPTESKRLFYTSVSLLLSRIQGHHYLLYKFHIYALVYCIGVFLSGLLHSVSSSFIHLIRTDSNVFFLMAE